MKNIFYRGIGKGIDSLQNKKRNGFTLIEILVVIGIIAVLAAIVIIAINPARQFAQARNTQRQSNIEAILNAVGQRMADNKGIFQGSFGGYNCNSLPTVATAGANGADILDSAGAASSSASADLSCLTPTYISIFPTDPVTASGNDTGYTIVLDANGRVKVCAPAASAETAIVGASQTPMCVTR